MSMSPVRRIVEWTAGVGLILIGLVGLVLPGLQGIVMILAGLAILSSHSPLARRLYDGIKSRVKGARDRWRAR